MFLRDEILLPGLGIGGYRSFPEMRYFSPLGKVTLLAGQNNVGKSNVIRFLDRFLCSPAPAREWADEPKPSGSSLTLAMGYRLDEAKYAEWLSIPQVRGKIDRFLALPAFHPTGASDLIWLERTQTRQETYGADDRRLWDLSPGFVQSVLDGAHEEEMRLETLRNGLFNTTGGSEEGNVLAVLNHMFPFADPPKVEVIQAFRRVADAGEADHSGGSLISTLAAHQNPGVQQRNLRGKFDAINRFVQVVMEDDSVAIEIPVERDTILVHQGGLVLPLDDLGTGIHQVVILAAAATMLDKTLVCIEEPEVNLHPVLQRKLVRYLSDNTSNQYLIATHSAHMLDFDRASVIHLRKTADGTVASHATRTQDVADVCADLGYRPSDVLQANAVIWVEGPSDRTYLQHWLRMVEPDSPYIEGIHYSIMFYGGAMLSHLTGEDPEDDVDVREFITLRRLNRHSLIIIDSDRRTPGAQLNPTKRRIIQEFDREDMPGHAWVTAGYTIENYVPLDLIRGAVEAVHPQAVHQYGGEKWSNPLLAVSGKDNQKAAKLHKVRIAAAVVNQWDQSIPLDSALRREVMRVHQFIAEANR